MGKITQAFTDILKMTNDKEIVYYYMQQLNLNLISSKNPFVTIKILTKYIEEYLERKSDAENAMPSLKALFIEEIESKFQIIESIIQDLQTYMNFVKTRLPLLTPEQLEGVNEQETFGQNKPHIEQIKNRLHLIGLLIGESN